MLESGAQAFPSLQQALLGCAGLGDMAQAMLLKLECACDSSRDLKNADFDSLGLEVLAKILHF